MNWDQIESKWVLMTRRIRADFGDTQDDATGVSVRTVTRRETLDASIAKSQITTRMDPTLKTSVK